MSDATQPNLSNIKRARMAGGLIGPEVINQVEHINSAGARLTMGDVLVPGDVITDDASAAARLVRVGNICRIEVTVDTYVAFGLVDLDPVTSATTPAVKLKAGMHLVAATDNYIRSSVALTRLEVISK